MVLLKGGHSTTELIYHFTFVPKYRRRRLVGKIKLRLAGMIRFTAQVNEWKILELSIQPDHVHLLLQARADDSPSSIMHLIKGGTSRKLRELFPGLIENSIAKVFWADGYFAGTVGDRSLPIVAKYVRNQDKHYVKEPR